MRQLEEALQLLAGQDQAVDPGELITGIEQELSHEGVPVVSIDGSRVVGTGLEPPGITDRRIRKTAWVFAAALAAVVMAIGIPTWMFGGEEPDTAGEPVVATTTTTTVEVEAAVSPETTASVPTEPTTVYSWVFDLSNWVTEDEMTVLLEDLSRRFYADTADGDLGGRVTLAKPSSAEFIWGVGFWSVGAHDGGGYHPRPTLTDPRLPDGVTYWGDSQSYGFSGPNSDQAICITLTTPGTTASILEEPNYETIFFEIATMMLHEMGWTD